jgi:pilus assembly protein Flp/PilA
MVRLLQAWLWLREKGQGLVEYALILVLIAVVVIAVLTLLGNQVSAVFETIVNALGGQGGQ